MANQTPVYVKTIAEYHRLLELPAPEHPLVSVIRFEDMAYPPKYTSKALVHSFYSIALKRTFQAKLKYGQQEVDFDKGVMLFMAPMQVLSIEGPYETAAGHKGWLLLIHPDLLWNTPLANKIRRYEYFDYQANEALHLSDAEEQMIVGIMQNIAHEYRSRLDDFSQNVMVAHIELLLTYAERFYQRQFITRKAGNHQIINRMEKLLNDYFKAERQALEGIPSVNYFADELHISPNYLSRLLTSLTGQSTKQFITNKVLDLAKEKLTTTSLGMNEIAYLLGFEHPQSFNKLFKRRTNMSPMEFRASFN